MNTKFNGKRQSKCYPELLLSLSKCPVVPVFIVWQD